jgi:hypothetical protein
VASVRDAQNVTLSNATVTFANVANSGTITRVDGGTWSGYAVGQGIVIGSAGTADPNANSAGAYYTIVAIDSTNKVITLKGGQLLTPEANVVVKVAPLAPRDNIEGASIVIEAGQAAIGTSAAPINIEVLGTGHGLTARAQNDIFVNAIGDMPVDGIYSASAGAHLTATGSIYDLIGSTFAKIQANSLELQVYGANSTIGKGTDLQHPLHIDIVGNGALQAIAPGTIAIDQTDGNLNVLNVLSKAGDVALGAAGFLLNGGNVVDPSKLDSGLASGNGGANVRGNSIVLNPDPATDPFWVTTKGGIGTTTTSFNIISGFNGGNGTLTATAGNQNVYIVQTVGNVSLMTISPGATAVAFVTALAGNILNGRPDENAIVKAGMADLIASGSVGSGNLRGALTGRIVSTVGNIEAIATSGDIWLWNKGGLKAGGVTASPFAMYAPHGSVNIQTSSPLEIADDIFASGPIVKNAGTTPLLDDNLTVDPGVTITSSGSSIELDAGNNLTVSGASGGKAAASLIAATSITLRAGYIPGSGFDGFGVTMDLAGSFTAPTLNIATGGGADDIELHPAVIAANTFVTTGSGNDTIHLYGMPTITAANSGVIDTVHLDGQDGADAYVIDITGNANYIVTVHDTGALDSGTNALTIDGTNAADTFLVRPYLVAALESNGTGGYLQSYERINCDETITDRLTINGLGGNDAFYLDGNSAAMTIDGGAGDDTFQVGQMYSKDAFDPLTRNVGILPGDGFGTTQTTLGYLSHGIDKATVLYGGTGNDTFQVYSNKADISLFGEDGDDTFIIRAFLIEGSVKVSGGLGNDTIKYNINAPVDVDGGSGFNTLVLLGTEANDTFVVTKDGIFGAGLNVAYTNIQAVTVDALEGDDTIYVLSTLPGVVTTLIGGTGGDAFVVGGDVQGTVVSASSKGASGVVDHSVTSNDPNYQGIFVGGIGLTIGGKDGALIQQDPLTVVHANDATSIASFVVTMPQAFAFSVNSKSMSTSPPRKSPARPRRPAGRAWSCRSTAPHGPVRAPPRWRSMPAIGRAGSGSTCARLRATSTPARRRSPSPAPSSATPIRASTPARCRSSRSSSRTPRPD